MALPFAQLRRRAASMLSPPAAAVTIPQREMSAVAISDLSQLAGGAVGYEGASLQPRLSPWKPNRSHINTILASEGPLLRARVRQMVANTSYGANASETFVAYATGAGITPAPQIDDNEELVSEITEAFNDWTDEADADGLTDFYGLQSLCARALFDAGEVFVRFRPRFASDGLTVPLQLQLLESEQLDQAFSIDLGNGSYIRQGIEFNAIGQRQAYHFWRVHPNDPIPGKPLADRVRVPADSVLHLFKPMRPGQIRGRPWLTAGMVKLHDLDEYDDFELSRKRSSAMFMGFITKELGEQDAGLVGLVDGQQPDAYGTASVTMEPSTMHVLPPGLDVKFAEPTDVGTNYEQFQYRNLLSLCASMGLPYYAVSGDTSKANYSSLRAALVELRRRMEQFQHEVMVFQLCRPVWSRWLPTALLAGRLRIAGFTRDPMSFSRCLWIPPKWDWVDPLKDVQAEVLEVANGFKSRDAVILGRGQRPATVDAEIKAGNDRAERLGITIGSTAPMAGGAAQQGASEAPPADGGDAPPGSQPSNQPGDARQTAVA